MRTRYINATLVDARGESTGELVTQNGVIAADTQSACDETVDVHGLVLMPAFVDTHCHLRDPGWAQKETMETGMRAALKGGFATICAMANTNPVCDTAERVSANHAKAKALRLCRLMQAGAAGIGLSDGEATDYAALSSVTRVISNDGKTIFNNAFMETLLCASQKYGFIVSTHCQPERATVKRDIALLRHTGGHLHVGHISRLETADMLRAAKADGLNVTCEVMPHHIFDHDNPYKVNPPMRTKADVDGLLQAIRDGVVDCLATDHAPHTEADKLAGAAGISNFEHAAAMFCHVFHENGMSLTLLSRLMSHNPSRLLGLGDGLLSPGGRADLIIFDPDEAWIIKKDEMISRSHNTPFSDCKVRGRVIRTIVEGETRYDYRQTI